MLCPQLGVGLLTWVQIGAVQIEIVLVEIGVVRTEVVLAEIGPELLPFGIGQ